MVFVIFYITTTFLLVPPLAKLYGRVAMPVSETDHVEPLNFVTCLLNRHYVQPQLHETAISVAGNMNKTYPGSTLHYLDAGFPFLKGFPLFPHLSHDDGRKLDVAFFYIDKATGKATADCPSPIGYGVSELPKAGETDMANDCAGRRAWQYSLLTKLVPQKNKSKFLFDSMRTKEMVNLFAKEKQVEKIFIEPHLKTRLKLTSDKIRFHGCDAVRHDDHLHVQIK